MRTLAIVLIIVGFSISAAPAPPALKKANHPVSIDDMAFNPASVEIKVGDSVQWTNNDERDHNVTSKDKSFSSGNLSSGGTFSFTFKKAGKFSYGCSLHPRMKGTVVVRD